MNKEFSLYAVVPTDESLRLSARDGAREPRRVYFAPPPGGAAGTEPPTRTADEEIASYMLDVLLALKRLAGTRRYRFLVYLIDMAMEEARLCGTGRSALAPPRHRRRR